MRIGRIHNVTRDQHVALEDAYPRIFDRINDGFDNALCTMDEVGDGEYISHLSVGGINVIFRQDSQGFKSLQTMSDSELAELQKRIDADYDASLDIDSWDFDVDAAERETMREARRIVGLD